MEIHQTEMHANNVGGAPGVFVSGLAWVAAGVAALNYDPVVVFGVLFIAGMFIVPFSTWIAKAAFKAEPVASTNPLNRLGLEVTIPLFAGLLSAWLVLPLDARLAFGILITIVGARYFSFASLYGSKTFWVLGGALFLVGTGLALNWFDLSLNALIWVGAIELFFAGYLLRQFRKGK